MVPAAIEVGKELTESAAMLWAPGSALSHFSAARHAGIWVPDSDSAWITTRIPSGKRSRDGLEVYRTRTFPKKTETDGFHVWTPAPRIVVDLAGKTTRRQLEAVLLSVIRNGKATAEDIAAASANVDRRRGKAMLDELLSLWSPERETMLEDLLFGDVVAVVPEEVTRQLTIESRAGRTLARLDVAVRALLLAFEADGLFFHSTDVQIAKDQARDRSLLKVGWQTVRFREGVLDDRAGVRNEVREVADRRRRDLRGSAA